MASLYGSLRHQCIQPSANRHKLRPSMEKFLFRLLKTIGVTAAKSHFHDGRANGFAIFSIGIIVIRKNPPPKMVYVFTIFPFESGCEACPFIKWNQECQFYPTSMHGRPREQFSSHHVNNRPSGFCNNKPSVRDPHAKYMRPPFHFLGIKRLALNK